MRPLLLLSLLCVVCSCANRSGDVDPDQIKEEIVAVETAFADAAGKHGVKRAFLTYAADEAVLVRGSRVIKGKVEIENYFDQSTHSDVSLKWKPEFVDVSLIGDMAYTYGPYTYSAKDTSGTEVNVSGIFHTIWKRQDDGSWKFVYD
jgi:ketosteroid isomerase-like protein